MISEDDCISERIHDSDSETNENVLHWVHQFLQNKITQEQLEKVFVKAYADNNFISPPWHLTIEKVIA